MITSDKLLTMVDISRPTLFKRLKRAFESTGVVSFHDAGTFFVRKSATRGKGYEILPVNYNPQAFSDADIVKGILEQLKNMRGVVCEDCKAQVVDKVIEQLEEKAK